MSGFEETGQGLEGPILEGDDALAAEYVVGCLAEDERAAVAERIDNDANFARLVDGWEARLAPIGGGYAPVEPPTAVKAAIDRRLGLASQKTETRTGFWQSLAMWRMMAMGGLAAAALAIAVPMVTVPDTSAQKYVASLSQQNSDMSFMAMYDEGESMLSVKMMDGAQPPANDLELWMIESGKAPVSMGVLPAGSTARMKVPMPMRPMVKPGVMLAVSMEPMGGSKTGAPTGPVIAMGDLRTI